MQQYSLVVTNGTTDQVSALLRCQVWASQVESVSAAVCCVCCVWCGLPCFCSLWIQMECFGRVDFIIFNFFHEFVKKWIIHYISAFLKLFYTKRYSDASQWQWQYSCYISNFCISASYHCIALVATLFLEDSVYLVKSKANLINN